MHSHLQELSLIYEEIRRYHTYSNIKYFQESLDSNALSYASSSDLGLYNRMLDIPDKKPYGFWMDRHGNYLPVTGGMGSHELAAIQILENLNDTLPNQDKIPLNKIKSIYDFLLQAGWIRVLCSYSTIYWEMYPGTTPNQIQKKNLKFMQEFYECSNLEMG